MRRRRDPAISLWFVIPMFYSSRIRCGEILVRGTMNFSLSIAGEVRYFNKMKLIQK